MLVKVLKKKYLRLVALFFIQSLNAASWDVDSNGNWSDDVNWTTTAPNANGAEAIFPGSAISANRIITLDTDIRVGSIDFSNVTNNYTISGPNTLIMNNNGSAATIDVTNSSVIDRPSVVVDILLEDNLEITSNVSFAKSSVISGTGTGITKLGAGDLLLSGASTYTGSTTIMNGSITTGPFSSQSFSNTSGVFIGVDGTLEADLFGASLIVPNLSGSGSFTLTGPATVQSSSDTIFSGEITGSATLTKTGDSSFTISGTTAHTGAIEVSAGTLSVTGDISASSGVSVVSGATLKGTGTLPATTVAGTIAAGLSIGTMTLDSLEISSGGTLELEISPSSTDLYDISGEAVIDSGATLLIVPQAGTYTGTTHTFIDADGGLTGTFDTVTIDTTNFEGAVTNEVSYTATQAQIVLTGTLSASAAGGVPLAEDTAMVDLTSDLVTRINRTQIALFSEVQNQRFIQRELGCFLPVCSENKKKKSNIFTLYQKADCKSQQLLYPYLVYDYSRATVRERKHMLPGKNYLNTILVGCDFYINEDFIIGGGAGYTSGQGSSSNGYGHLTSNSFNLGAYFQGRAEENWFVDGVFNWGKNFFESKRSVNNFSLARYHGYDLSSQIRLLYQNFLFMVNYRPYISTTYYLQQIGNYTERNEHSNQLKVGKDHYNFLELEAGLALWAPFAISFWKIIPQIAVAYTQGLCRKPHDVDVAFVSNYIANQQVRVANITDKQWKLQVGLSANYPKCTEVFINYEALFDNAYSNYQEYRVGVQTAF